MNTIHPTAVISDGVVLGTGNTIGPFVVIDGPVTLGDDNWIGAGVVIGCPPEVRSFPHPREISDPRGGGVTIGSRNTIREYAQIHQGWKSQTRIGDDAFIMNQSYIAHDVVLGDGATLASSVLLAGHVRVGAGANLGLGTSVHQFRSIGQGSMVGMGSVVTRDLPPYAKAFGSPAIVRGANVIGMERSGVAEDVIRELRALYGAAEEEAPFDPAVLEGVVEPGLLEAVEVWMRNRSDSAR